jgi:CHAD domain-containing protein
LLEPQLLARVHIDQSRERALASLSNSLETDDDVQLHAARVDLKKWRYALETSAALFDSGVPLEPLRDLQSALGDVHDLAVLRDRLLRRVGKLRDANMVTHADALNPALEALTTERAQTLEKLAGSAHDLPKPCPA